MSGRRDKGQIHFLLRQRASHPSARAPGCAVHTSSSSSSPWPPGSLHTSPPAQDPAFALLSAWKLTQAAARLLTHFFQVFIYMSPTQGVFLTNPFTTADRPLAWGPLPLIIVFHLS